MLTQISISKSGKPIYRQVCDGIREQIINGSLQPNSRMPASRNYAIEIGVSRTSVTAAFEQLKAEGYLTSRQGSGYYVSSIGNLDHVSRLKHSDIDDQEKSDKDAASSPVTVGETDKRLFPYRKWAKCVSKVGRQSPELLIDVADVFGNISLRKSIAEYLLEWRGIQVSPYQIIITAGSIDALELCVRTLASYDAKIGLENPGYLQLRTFAKQIGLKPVWLPVDENGAQISAVRNSRKSQPRLVVITPSHQFPLGGTMSPGRRAEFIDWAKKANSWIIEDDYDSEFRYSGSPIPALMSTDSANRTIYVGSFSKIFSTGLRLGFLVSPVALLDSFSLALNKFSTKASVAMQQPLSEFMNTGEFYRQIRRVRRIYGERRNLLIELLAKDFRDLLSIEDFQAGTQLVGQLPGDVDDKKIAVEANKLGIPVSPLSNYYTDDSKVSGLVLGFCAHNEQEIKNSVSALREIMDQYA